MRAVGAGNGPRNHIDEQLRQNVLDAAAILQLQRSRVAAALSQRMSGGGGSSDDVVDGEVIGAGYDEIDEWMGESIRTWRELLSVKPAVTLAQLRLSVPVNRQFVADGSRMISLFDHDATEREAREFLAHEAHGSYLLGFAAVQMKLVDRRFVLLQGPQLDGQISVMRVRDHAVLAAAWRYWHAVVASSVQANREVGLTGSADQPTAHGDAGGLSSRQWRIVTLLATDTRDEAIADALGVSVRTVRADISDMLRTLGVRTRFAAGLRLGYALSPGETAVPGFTDPPEGPGLPGPRPSVED